MCVIFIYLLSEVGIKGEYVKHLWLTTFAEVGVIFKGVFVENPFEDFYLFQQCPTL